VDKPEQVRRAVILLLGQNSGSGHRRDEHRPICSVAGHARERVVGVNLHCGIADSGDRGIVLVVYRRRSGLVPSAHSVTVRSNNAIDRDAGKRCALPGARHRGR